ncbi:MAG: oligosaccharide flippase family protein [Desulfuromonadaceae bacterium]|nr:oligosaccharide flippase family protein [Desulfuromonadaceae bacterium]MDD5104824.1 oligosaccharide flippase family protein [Desulfuromonadaceae bacterium]
MSSLSARSIIGNSLSGGLVPFIRVIITFIVSPLIVRGLGNYDYGIWEMVFAVVGYMGILDMGLAPAIVRYVSRHHALGDNKELKRIYSSSMAFFLLVGLATALVLIAMAYWAPKLIMQGAVVGDSKKYFIFILIVAAITFVTFVGSLFDCFLEGFQKYKLRNYTTVFMMVAGNLVLYFLLKSGGGLLAVAVVNAAGLTIKFTIYGIMLATNRFGSFRFRFADTSFVTLKGLFSFGFKNLVYAVALRISTVTDSLIIGTFLGPAIVTLYIIPYNFICQGRDLVWALSRNFMPLFSELDALDHGEAAQRLYFKASRFMIGIILPLLIGMVMLGPSFLEHWMGAEYAQSGRLVIYIIAAAYGVGWLNPLASKLLVGYGEHGIMAKVAIIASFFNLGLSLVLVQYLGKEGVALGTLLPALVCEPLYFVKVCKVLKTTVWGYAVKVLVPLLVPSGVLVATIGVCCWFHSPASLLQVLMIATFSMCLYLPAFFLLSITTEERQLVMKKIGLQTVEKS